MSQEEQFLNRLKNAASEEQVVAVVEAIVEHMFRFEDKIMQRLDGYGQYIQNIKQGPAGNPGNSIVGPKGDKGDKGEDGRGIPGRNGKDGSPDNGEQIVVKINKDKSGKKIKKEHVEGLSDIEDLAKQANANVYALRAAGDTIYVTDLSSYTNGVLKTFTVPAHRRAIMVVGSDFPNILLPNNGFTHTNSTVTLTVDNAPSSGSQLGFMYVV